MDKRNHTEIFHLVGYTGTRTSEMTEKGILLY